MSPLLNYDIQVGKYLESIIIKNDDDYEERLEYAEELMKRANEGEDHIYPVLDLVSKKIMEYEELHYPVEDTTPESMMEFLMDQHGHKQKDMKDVATQSVISEVLKGKRKLNFKQVQALVSKYKVSADLFYH